MKQIKLTKGRFAIVDDEDFEYLNQFKWCMFGKYAGRYNGKSYQSMHRLIMQTPIGMVTDHINGDALDNQKSNLRICTQSENCRNRKPSGRPKGIFWRKEKKRWIAYIVIHLEGVKKQIRLGSYKTQEDAAKAYDIAAIKYFGDFASLNYGGRNV